MRIMTLVSWPSNTRGGAKKYVGPISRRSVIIVCAPSGQFTQNPVQ